MAKNERVAVVGLGYVGLPLALLAKEKGYEVIGIDNTIAKVNLINKGTSPIADNVLIKWMEKVKIKATTNFVEASDVDIFLICVPTPVINKTEPDLGPLKAAVESVAKVMKKDALIVVESTINPSVCDEVVLPLIKQVSGYAESEFDLAHCPERINPGDPKWTIRNINRVVGAHTKKGLARALKFYTSIIEAEIKPMETMKEAEACKVVENTFRDINIAFINELAMSFHRLGINIENVIDGASTKPFAFMAHRPGPGVGGHCIPVDPYYLIEYAKSHGFQHDFLNMARRVNTHMPQFTVELMQDALNDAGRPLKNTKIALLGLAYKANVDDDRESPAYEIQHLLEQHGANVLTYDPFVPANSSHTSLDAILDDAEAVLLVTGHDEFKSLTPKKLADDGIKAIVDGKNVFKDIRYEFAKHGIIYTGIGVRP